MPNVPNNDATSDLFIPKYFHDFGLGPNLGPISEMKRISVIKKET